VKGVILNLQYSSEKSSFWDSADPLAVVGQTAGILACDIDVGTVSSSKNLLIFYHHYMVPCCKVEVGEGEVNSVGKLHQI
jgi:hypothetical protein